MLTIRQLDKLDIRQLDESGRSTGPMVSIRIVADESFVADESSATTVS